MPYVAEISRQSPSCFLFLIDQSGSMGDHFGGDAGRSKAQRLADAVNRLLFELTIRCTKSEAEGVRNYYEVGVIGYGGRVGPAWVGTLAGKKLISMREVADNPGRLEEREKTKLPIWFEPVSDNGTPMRQALEAAYSILEPWVQSHPASFPPIAINITDGEATDGDFRPSAEQIKGLSTDDGQALLFNVHLSSNPGSPVLYCDSETGLNDEFSKMLFQASSVLPPHIQNAAKSEGYSVGSMARGFVFNADIIEVVKFLDIGTRAKALR
jgi:hypothetical protein